jgi:signal transduction histidine kinase/tRNA A-37 threonylcarbamoyl transferase component Bud32
LFWSRYDGKKGKALNLVGKTINNRYHITKQLGEGGMSRVFQARDRHKDQNVAIKIMRKSLTSTYLEDLIRFRREIEIISKLKHPNIIEVYGQYEYETTPFIVMELLAGHNLSKLLENGTRFSIPEIIRIIKQLAEALNYVHNHGIIHRDLKPSNIFIDEQNQLKLLDFGVALVIELSAIREEKMIAGTFGYMSPEATGILDKRIDERSDLYSLGVIFYHLITGMPPFKGSEINQLLHQQVALIPTRPKRINPEISVVLEEMILKLLQKDPDLRYQSARGLLADLECVESGDYDFEIGCKDQKIKLTYQTRLVGREQEFRKVESLFDSAVKGNGGICLIAGEAGIGKSRLVEEIRGYVYEKNGLFIRGRCLNYENKFPYQPFKDAIDEFVNKIIYLNKETAAREIQRFKTVLGDLSGIVVNLNSRLEKLFGETKELVPLEPERENQRSLLVLSDFFCNLTDQNQACVLFLDDLQWADESSLNLLIEILRKINHTNLLVLGTYRNNELRAGHKLEFINKSAAEHGYHLEVIELKSFDPSKINQLIENILGEKNDSQELSDYIYKKSNGNPFFAINIIRELVETKVIRWEEGIWKKEIQKLNEIPVSHSLIDIILRRIENLSGKQWELLARGAVIGREFEIELLYRLTTLTKIEVVNMIDDFITLQLLERSAEHGRVLFVHDRIRDAFYHTLDEEEKRRIHFQIAQAIEHMNQGRHDKVIYELAYHYVESGDQEKSLTYVIPAAVKAKNSHANEEAIKYYEIGINILEQKDRKNGMEWFLANEELGKIYLVIGMNDDAIAIAQNLLNSAVDRNTKARLFKTIGIAYFKKGDWINCENTLSYALNLLGERFPQNMFQRILAVLKEFLVYGFNTLILQHICRQREITVLDEKKKEIIWTYEPLSWMYMLNDAGKLIYNLFRQLNVADASQPKTKEAALVNAEFGGFLMAIPLFKLSYRYHQKALRLRKILGDEWGEAQSLQFLGYQYAWQGNPLESMHNFELAVAKFKKMGDLWEQGMTINGLSFYYYYMGNYEKSVTLFNQYLDLSNRLKDNYGLYSAKINMSRCYIETGDFAKAESLLNDVFNAKGTTINSLPFLLCVGNMLFGMLKIESNLEKAIEYLETAKKIDNNNLLIKNYTSQLYPYLAEAQLRFITRNSAGSHPLSKPERAMLKSLCREARKKTRPWVTQYGNALLVSAKYYIMIGQPILARQYFLKAIVHQQKINLRYQLVRSYFEYGNFLNQSDKNEAIIYYRKAHEIATEINAKVYIQKCREMLGISQPVENPEAVAELTAQNRLKSDRRMETLLTNSADISSILDTDELLEKIMDNAIELVGAERGILWLYSENDRKLEMKVLRNVPQGEFEKGFTASISIISRVESEKQPIIVSDASIEEDFKMQSSVVLHGIRSVMAAPIMLRGTMLGILYLDNNLVSGLFGEEDLRIINLLLNQAGISIENARLYRGLTQLNQELEERVRDRTEQLNEKNGELKAKNDELVVKNQELAILNQQLKEHAATIEELAIVKERNRMAREVHDTLGHTLTLLIMLVKVGRIKLEEDPLEAKDKLSQAVEIAQEGLEELRRSIMGLMPENAGNNNIVLSLETLIESAQKSGLEVDFSVNGEEFYYKNMALRSSFPFNDCIYKTCQEAITNSLRHGNATKIGIILRFSAGKLVIFIIDNGKGCKDIQKGFGLKGMESRIQGLNGHIIYGSDGEKGFNIHIEIPISSS